MARRRKSSTAEDVLDVLALLPWWGCVALAILSFAVLHALAVPPSATGLQAGGIANVVMRGWISGLAFAGQFVLPVLFLFAAAASFARRRKREGLVNQVSRSQGAAALNTMSWLEFELMVGEAFRMQGYEVTEQGGAQADGGVDLLLRKGSETFVVQCKQWKAFKVGVAVVRELYGVMAARGAAGGFVITSGRFTADAKAFAEGRNVMLVEGPKLFGLIQQVKASLRAGTTSTNKPSPQVAPGPPGAAPHCPKCAAAMVRRTAKKGSHAGSQFWGCSKYPACLGTR